MKRNTLWGRLALLLGMALFLPLAHAQDYTPADKGQRPSGGTQVLPDQFLRGFDPVTVYFADNVGAAAGPADDGPRHLKVAPAWPGQYFWADRKTLQFRPAEAWPPLKRFSVEAAGARKVLATMMSAPSAMSPPPGSDNLRPFRTLTLTFPQALPLDALKQMIRLEVRDLPGLADSTRRAVTDVSITQLPRARDRDPAVYAITLNQDIPEGRRLLVSISLALGDEDKVLWTGRLTTRMPFHLESVQCGATNFSLVGGASVPRDMALSCGTNGEQPQLAFSADVSGLTLTTLKQLVRLEPAVPDLRFETYGSRVQLRGRFVPDTLYKMHISAAPIHDDSGRALSDPGNLDTFFYLGWKSPFLRWDRSGALVEANGPRMLPLTGYGDPRADVRVYRIDPLNNGLWPFPGSPFVVAEETDPPFPGEEPTTPSQPQRRTPSNLAEHIRLLGTPLVSRIVDLPLANKGGVTRFGLDLGALLDGPVGRNRPGTYLVGLRRLTGRPERAYVRVQVTNLSLTVTEERDRAVFFVRSLDRADAVRGARIQLDGERWEEDSRGRRITVPATVALTTDENGRASQGLLEHWTSIDRISVHNGEDILVLNPSEAPPSFANNHWSPSSSWLGWLMSTVPAPSNDRHAAFVFTERPIYRPNEPVFIKGYVRKKLGGELKGPGSARQYTMKVDGPDGQSWNLPVAFTPLGGFSGEFKEKDIATGTYTVSVFSKEEQRDIGSRTFQIEAYRIPTFEVQLAAATAVRLDQPFKTRALARYYAGGNVAGVPIKWTVTRRSYFHVPQGRPGYLFASSAQFARPGAAHGPEIITRTGTLDDEGSDTLSINPALDIDGTPRIYRFEVTVTGADDQQVSTVQETRALPPFVLGLKVPRYLEKATELKPDIIAVGFDDKLLKGQDVNVKVFKRVWHSQLRETNFATGEAKYVTEQEDVKLHDKTITTADTGAVTPSFPITEAGVYVVELTARDKLGRVQTLNADLFVGGPQPVAWQKSREGVFELSPDKKTYKPGDVAKVVVQSPFQTGKALLVVEEPGGNTYTWKDVSGGKTVHEVKIGANHTPNLPIHVVLMRGRLGDSKTDDSRFKPETLAASLDLEVEPVKNQVTVKVDHPEAARPGQKVELTVTLQDDQKKPLGGEVTLWLVDEAVLSLAKEGPLDPLTRFIDRNARTSSVRDTRNLTVGRLLEQDEEPGGDGGEEEEGSGGRVVRKNFQTVPYYQATLNVPASGKLVVPVTLSDDLTNFKVRAVAASGVTRFGNWSSTLKVRLPVIIQPQLPRFVRQGDRFQAGGIARLLEGAEGPASVDISIKGPVEGNKDKKSTDLKMSRAQSVTWGFAAKSTNALEPTELTVKVGVTRKSDGVGDAFEVKLPLLPDRTLERLGYVERLAEGAFKVKPFPEPVRPGTASQQLTVTNVPGALELASAMDYLSEYPHGCLEQRMSQLYPQVVQAEYLKKLGFDVEFTPKAAQTVRKMLEEMPAYQTDQGLFGYWPGSPGDVQVTAQVVEFVHSARRAGVIVDEKIQTRAIEGLKRVLRSDFTGYIPGYKFNQQVAALTALSRVGLLDEHYVVELFNRRNELDIESRAQLAVLMGERGGQFKSMTDTAKKDLWDSTVFKLQRGKPTFEGLKWGRTNWYGGYLVSYVSSVSSVFEGLLVLDPKDARHEQLRDALLSYATPSGGFGSTFDNRRAIQALGSYMDRARHPVANVEVSLEGQSSLNLDEKRKVTQRRIVSDTPLGGTIKGGEVGLRAYLTYLPLATGDQVKALKQGFLVNRSSRLLHADGTMDAQLVDAAGSTQTVNVGDILEISTTLVSDEERNHVALVVPFAAGLEPLNPALQTSGSDARPSQQDTLTPSYVQRLDSETRYYFTRLPRGTHSFHFRARAITQGSFVHPPPFAEQMYKQDVRGRGEGLRLNVVAAAAE